MLKSSNSNDDILPLTNQQLIQRSSFNETMEAMFLEQPENSRRNRKSRLHHDMLELALGFGIFLMGVYLPKMFLVPSVMDALVSKPPPMQLTQAGDVLRDLELNEPLVDPATVSLTIPAIFLFVMEILTTVPRRPAMILASFFTAIGISEGTTQVLKLMVQRRRPNFYALCGFDARSCAASNPHHIMEAQLSFPSGHSSLSMCAAVFVWQYCLFKLALYARRKRHVVSLFRRHTMIAALLTVCLIGASVGIGVTRLVDHWHHPSDVVAGWVLGAVVATGVYRSQILYSHNNPSTKNESTLLPDAP